MTKMRLILVIVFASFCIIGGAMSDKCLAKEHYLSANVPLDSYVYDYLAKLQGMGYMDGMLPGNKPYTRSQVAKWVVRMNSVTAKQIVPLYARNMLEQLTREFAPELKQLAGNKIEHTVLLKDWTAGVSWYNGGTLPEARTRATFQPLNINNNGYRLKEGFNFIPAMHFTGNFDHLVVDAVVRSNVNADNTSSSLESGYVKTNIDNLSVEVGKDASWWGQGLRGSRSYTNNAPPMTGIKLTNIDPLLFNGGLKFLGPTNITVSYTILEQNRADVPYPSFGGLRFDFSPTKNSTFGLSNMAIFGGRGHSLHGLNDYFGLIGYTPAKNDKSDSQAGIDFRLRFPGFQFYGEFYGEDTPPKHSHELFIAGISRLFGIYIPKLSASGDWDANIEWAQTTGVWYAHSIYTSGWTYRDNIIGDAMGNNANRYYAKITYYSAANTQLSFNFERLIQQDDTSVPQKVNSYWLSGRTRIGDDIFLVGNAGLAQVQNSGYKSGLSSRNRIYSLYVTKKYY